MKINILLHLPFWSRSKIRMSVSCSASNKQKNINIETVGHAIIQMCLFSVLYRESVACFNQKCPSLPVWTTVEAWPALVEVNSCDGDWFMEPTWNLSYGGPGHRREAFKHLKVLQFILNCTVPQKVKKQQLSSFRINRNHFCDHSKYIPASVIAHKKIKK